MKYNKFAIMDEKKEYIKWPTAFREKEEYTKDLYDAHLWDSEEFAEAYANCMNYNKKTKLIVVEV